VLGARVVASVRSEQHRPAVAALGAEAMGADDAFARVKELGGADVILELVGGPHMAGNIDALARSGRLVLVAAKPGEEATIVLRDLMTKRAHLMGTTLRTRPPEQKAQLTQEFAARIVPYLAAGTIRPVVDRTFPLEQVGEALDAVRAPGKLGKLLLELP
jgi:NADPH2:quinone reductase